jgi:hypothetical protein
MKKNLFFFSFFTLWWGFFSFFFFVSPHRGAALNPAGLLFLCLPFGEYRSPYGSLFALPGRPYRSQNK